MYKSFLSSYEKDIFENISLFKVNMNNDTDNVVNIKIPLK